MSNSCTPTGYQQIFSRKNARSEANRYRRKGLDTTSRRIVDLVKKLGVDGRTLLEVGGGIGAIQLELLKAGVTRAMSVELTPTYEEVAAELLREAGMQDRVERRVMDLAEAPAGIETADIVVMNRVVCCYADMPKLAGAAADRASAMLVMSFPKDRWWTRLVVRSANFGLRVSRRQFQIFLHPPVQIVATAVQRGFTTRFDQSGMFWQVVALERVG